MFNNYHYFIVLCEEMNYSKAAKRLFISHQCLSKYIKNLEAEYQVSFFERSKKLSLTAAGEAFLKTVQQIDFLEQNLNRQLEDMRSSKVGTIKFATTEGRFRILIPSLLAEYKKIYPKVTVQAQYDVSQRLEDLVLNNKVDFAIMNKRDISKNQFSITQILTENLYLVISNNLLHNYFPDTYPACIEEFKKGVDLKAFSDVPFILNYPGFNSRDLLEAQMQLNDYKLNCILEMTQQDLHFMLAARDYGACFTWSMYIPMIQQSNLDTSLSHLNVFPVPSLACSNQVLLIAPKGKVYPQYMLDFIRLLKEQVTAYSTL